MAYIQCGRNVLRRIIEDTGLHSSDPALHPLYYLVQGVRHRKLEVILTTVRIESKPFYIVPSDDLIEFTHSCA